MDILSSCAISFAAVFALLGVLAALIKGVDALFPDETREDDAPVVAAIHTAVAASYPEARVTTIEEVRS